MPVTETVLIYGVIPLAVFLLLAVVTLLPGRGKEKTKYRPGQPWDAAPFTDALDGFARLEGGPLDAAVES